MKLAIIVGHSNLNEGARMAHPFEFISEYGYNKVLAGTVLSLLKEESPAIEARIFLRDGETIASTLEKVKEWFPDLSLELHFNWSDSPDVRRTEILWNKDEHGANALAESILSAFPDSGMKPRAKRVFCPIEGERGWVNLRGSWNQYLIEPFFGSNAEDCRFALLNINLIAKKIVDGFLKKPT